MIIEDAHLSQDNVEQRKKDDTDLVLAMELQTQDVLKPIKL